MAHDIKIQFKKLPTFLEAILKENDNIQLVYRENLNPVRSLINVDDSEHTIDENETLELTGTPLEIDLGNCEPVCMDMTMLHPPSWTCEEATYNPLSLAEARNILAEKLKSQCQNVHRIEAFYCICNGDDVLHTVILGTIPSRNSMSRILAYILPCCNSQHELTSVEYMKKDHIKNVTRNEKIRYHVSKCYFVWGYNLRNSPSLENAHNNGSVSIETTNDQIEESLSRSNFALNLQVVIGHKTSKIQGFSEDLGLIHSYINLLTNPDLIRNSTIICNSNHLDTLDIKASICDLLTNPENILKMDTKTSLDLNNVRQQNILDKLWEILKCCKTVSNLRDGFHFFFEELAETHRRIDITLKDNHSMVLEIVTGILDGRIAVPTLSLSQSLEFIIELGLEKLKQDCIAVVNNFYSLSKDEVLKRWESFSSDQVVKDDRKSTLKRRTSRMSVNFRAVNSNLTSSKLKLLYLHDIIKVIEFMILCKDHCKLSDEGFHHFCDVVWNHFTEKDNPESQFANVAKPKLCEFSFNISHIDANIVKELSPVNWSVRMDSALKFSDVTTIFYFSESPIFPPSIYDKYDIPLDQGDVKFFYVTKLVKYVNRFTRLA